jgi:hypothetical protein
MNAVVWDSMVLDWMVAMSMVWSRSSRLITTGLNHPTIAQQSQPLSRITSFCSWRPKEHTACATCLPGVLIVRSRESLSCLFQVLYTLDRRHIIFPTI